MGHDGGAARIPTRTRTTSRCRESPAMTRSAHRPTTRTVRAHAFVSAFIALLILTIGLAELGRAAEKGQTITLGESLSDAQRTQMLDLFKASPDDKVITITMSDTLEA